MRSRQNWGDSGGRTPEYCLKNQDDYDPDLLPGTLKFSENFPSAFFGMDLMALCVALMWTVIQCVFSREGHLVPVSFTFTKD